MAVNLNIPLGKPFVDVFSNSRYALVGQSQQEGRTIRKYHLRDLSEDSLTNAAATIRNLLERNDYLCPTFFICNLREEIKAKQYLIINGEAVCLSEEVNTSDVPTQYLDFYLSQDLLKQPVRCSKGHYLERSAVQFWLQRNTHCPGEGPQHPIGDFRVNEALQRNVADFRIARKAKKESRAAFGKTLKSPYEIDLIAKLYLPKAVLQVINKNPLTVRLIISGQSLTFNAAVKREAFEGVLKRLSQGNPINPNNDSANCLEVGTQLSDALDFETIQRSINGERPFPPLVNQTRQRQPSLKSGGQINQTMAKFSSMKGGIGISVPNPLSWLLNPLIEKVDQTIQEVITAGNNALLGLITQAGAEVKKAIDHFAEVYKDVLAYTLDQVSSSVQNSYNQLVSMVYRFATKAEQALHQVMLDAQQLVNTLPFTNLQPQLGAVIPRGFVVKDLNQKSRVSFHGNFFWCGIKEPAVFGWIFNDTEYSPSLTFANTKCQWIDSTTQELAFEFSNTIFGNLPDKKKYYMATGQLTVPWKDTGYLWNSINETNYHITLIALPQIAGTVSATFRSQVNVPNNVREQKTFTKSVSGKKYEAKWERFYPDQGAKFDPSTVKVTINGNYSKIVQSFTPECLGYTVHFMGNGSATYTITADQLRPVNAAQEVNRQEPPFELMWNEQKALQPRNGETLLQFVFEDCRGKQSIFAPPCLSQGILKIQAAANGLFLLRPETPSDINVFMNS